MHFSETYHAFNPLLRVLLEKRVHAFISKDNDRLIKESLTKGVRLPAQGQGQGSGQGAARRRTAAAGRRRRRRRPGVTVVDLWVNALTGKAAAAFMGQAGNEGIPELLGGDLSASSTLQQLLATMDACGVDVGCDRRRHRGRGDRPAAR